jgi:hypothetical protein
MRQPVPIAQDLVLVGGGHAHVHVPKRFGMRPSDGVRLTLVTRDVETPYSGMLPGYVAGLYSFAECHIDLVRLARFAGARLIHDEAIGLDRAGRPVICRAHPLQCLKPEWSTMACTDRDLSRVSRTRLVETYADSDALILPAHFPTPTAGHIKPHGAAYRFAFRE